MLQLFRVYVIPDFRSWIRIGVSLVLLKFRSTVPNRFNYLDISNEVANQNLYMLVFFKGILIPLILSTTM